MCEFISASLVLLFYFVFQIVIYNTLVGWVIIFHDLLYVCILPCHVSGK